MAGEEGENGGEMKKSHLVPTPKVVCKVVGAGVMLESEEMAEKLGIGGSTYEGTIVGKGAQDPLQVGRQLP